MGTEGAEISTADPERLAIAAVVPPLLTPHGQIHILKEPKGARGFDQMRGAPEIWTTSQPSPRSSGGATERPAAGCR